MKYKNKSISGIKLRAKKLESYLNSQGFVIKHSQALEAIAIEDNHPSWNHYLGFIENQEITQTELDLVCASPGNGLNIALSFHCLNLLEDNPTGHAIFYSPFSDYFGIEFDQWQEKMVHCPISMSDIKEPKNWLKNNSSLLKNIQGKILWVYKSSKGSDSIFSPEEDFQWLMAANQLIGKLHSKSSLLCSYFDNFHRYGNLLNKKEFFSLIKNKKSIIGTQVSKDMVLFNDFINDSYEFNICLNNYLVKPAHEDLLVVKRMNFNIVFIQNNKFISSEKLKNIGGWLELSCQCVYDKKWKVDSNSKAIFLLKQYQQKKF